MEYSKTNEGAASFWERLDVLRSVEEDVSAHLSEAGESCRGCGASIDDFLDAFVLALTALGYEEELHTLPEPGEVESDPKELPMEMVYRRA
jgi:predicted RNase H-like nuclease